MGQLREITNVATQEEQAVRLANEIHRLEVAVKAMKEDLKNYVEAYGQLTPAGKARVRRPRRKRFSSEEAEAVPAESNCPERTQTASIAVIMN